VNAAVVEDVKVPQVPISLPTGVKLLLALFLATAASVGLAFFKEYIDPSFRTPRDVEESLDLRLLAAIPKNGH